VSQLVKKFTAIYETQRFINVFTTARACHYWFRWIHSNSSQPILSRSIPILFFHLHLGFASGVFLWGFPSKFLYMFLFSNMLSKCSAPLALLVLDILMKDVSGEKISRKPSLCKLLFYPAISPSYFQALLAVDCTSIK